MAKQFKRANRALRSVRTFLGRVFRDIVRKTRDDAGLREIFAEPLSLAFRVRHQRQNQRGPKIYSLHAPEVECIGKGKAHRPYEFGVKVSVATTLARSNGGQFIAHVKALPAIREPALGLDGVDGPHGIICARVGSVERPTCGSHP